MLQRRHFIRQLAYSTAALGLSRYSRAADESLARFFVVADTHYCADADAITRMDETSALYNARLVEWLNKLPGTRFPDEVGGGEVPMPHGVIHAGDIVDNADKQGPKLQMAEAEIAAFVADWGLNGGDAKLRWAVREVHGNHDGPRGDSVVISEIKNRNQRRAGLTNLSPNGLHYSWDWAGVHFVALGIVVGDAPEITRTRRFSPLGSLPFLRQDLAEHVGRSGRPVVLVHHVDVARYCEPVADDIVVKHEWDYGDVQAYRETLKPYRVAASICGHTHVRNIFRWNGTKNTKAVEGTPFLNTDNGAHFNSETQAFLQVEITASSIRVREFATRDGWLNGAWTPQAWQLPLNG
jgi:hypothetical protein